MAKYDVETFFADLETFMKANLNTKIAAINTEKSDSITLATVADEAYFFQSLDERVANYNPIIFYGLTSDVESDGIGPYTSKKLKVNVTIIVNDQNLASLGKRYLRYNRALEEIFLENWDRAVNNGIKLKVTSPVLIDFTLLNDSQPYRVVGVELEANIG